MTGGGIVCRYAESLAGLQAGIVHAGGTAEGERGLGRQSGAWQGETAERDGEAVGCVDEPLLSMGVLGVGMSDVSALADAVRAADSVVALTGAGLSTASGVPTFRGEDGLYEEFDESAFAIRRFRTEPDAFWRDWLSLHEHFFDDAVAPNAAHDALATLERDGYLDAVLTQNVDGLHRAAGSDAIVHLHGTGLTATCQECGDGVDVEAANAVVEETASAPRCDCGGVYKPDTVLFGERLPSGALAAARRHAARADVVIAAGSSLTVDPAASLPALTQREGGEIAVVNLEATRYADTATYAFRERVEEVLPALVDVL
jgi:NAD-dependent deacetylase